MNNFRGFYRRKSYFEGWYLKHQGEDISIAFIPAFHIDENGKRTASIQVVTDKDTYYFPFMIKNFSKGISREFQVSKNHFYVKIGNNLFSDRGISVGLKNDKTEIAGTLRYSEFNPLRSDIMGPFRFFPFMQCSHGVLSMIHGLSGKLTINGREYDFGHGIGYAEKDYGSSFPRFYTWTQCGRRRGREGGSLMASAAHIPFGPFTFTGCICAVWYQGKEYRLATYLGARIERHTGNTLIVKQRKYKLEVYKIGTQEKQAKDKPEDYFLLYAPENGSMCRQIKENIACTVRYRFSVSGRVIFDFTDHKASFESVW